MVLSGYFLLDWGVKKALTKHVENFGSFLVRFCVDSTYISYGSRGATPSCDIWLESSQPHGSGPTNHL